MSLTPAERDQKLKELEQQEAKVKELQDQISGLKTRLSNNESLSQKDTNEFVSKLGWLSTAAVTIASIASSI